MTLTGTGTEDRERSGPSNGDAAAGRWRRRPVRAIGRRRAVAGGTGQAVERPPGPARLASPIDVLLRRFDPLDAFTRIASDHPRLAYLRLGPEDVYVVSHPDLVRELLVTQGRHTMKGRGLQNAKFLLGEGLLTSEPPLHRRQRRLVQPAFHRERIRRYAELMVAAGQDHLAGWDTRPDCAPVELHQEMSSLTLDAVGRSLFGADLRGDAADVGEALTEVLEGFQRRQMLPRAELVMRMPLPSNRRIRAAIERLDRVVARMVAEHRMAGDTGDLLSELVAARDPEVPGDGAGMTDQQLRDEVMTLVLAGHETTAVALTWSFYLLARHPAASARLRDEVDAALAGGPPNMATTRRLAWTTAVLAEAMRQYPPAWILGRRATADFELDGWRVPAGSLCLTSQWVLHHDARFWSDRAPAAEFRPERWLTPDGCFDESAPGQPRYAWFPFGAGSRVCIGESFAWTEGVLLLALIASRYDVRLVPGVPVDLRPAVTLRPAPGVPVTLRRRS